MLVVALNVGPLFFSFVPSLNNDVCEPFALKKIRITHVAFKTKLLFNKSIDMLKMAFEHGKYEMNVCWFN